MKPTWAKKGDKTKVNKRAIKNQIEKGKRQWKSETQKGEKWWINRKNQHKKAIKEEEPNIKILAHELLAYTFSYLMLRYSNPSNFSSWIPLVSSLVFLILPRYKPVPPQASAGLCYICPNHLKRYCINFFSIGITYNLSLMSSFWARYLLVWPNIYCSMRISVTLSCWICRILVG
jgi:hypothetical protein